MADNGAIDRPDLITDAAIAAPGVLDKDIQNLIGTIRQLIDTAKGLSGKDGLGGSLPKTNDDTVKLTQAQKELVKIEQQIAVAVARNNEAYQAQQKVLAGLRADMKAKNSVDEQAARNATILNSSITALGAALQKNKQDYANLRNEQERSTPAGKALLTTIQAQDAGYKKLRESIGINTDSVGKYEKAVEGLKGQFDGLLSTFGPAGEKIESIGGKALTAGQYIVGLSTGIAGIVTASAALVAGSLTAYFTRTAEGAKKLNEIAALLEYRFNTLKDNLAEFGGFLVDGASGFTKYASDGAKAFGILSKEEDAAADEFVKRSNEAKQLIKDRLKLSAEEAKQETEKDELLFEARNKLQHADEERLIFNEEAYAIQKKTSEEAVDQAKKELVNTTSRILLSNQERGITTLAAEDLAKLSELTIAVEEAKQKAFQGTRRIQAQNIQLQEEIYKRDVDLRAEDLKSQLDNNNSVVKADQIKNDAILANLKSTEDQRKTALQKNAKDEIQIAANARDQELADARQKAIDRIRNRVGASNFDSNPEQQEYVISQDKVLAQEREKIQQDFSNAILEINTKLQQAELTSHNEFVKARLDLELKGYNAEEDIQATALNKRIAADQRIEASLQTTYQQKVDAVADSEEAQQELIKVTHDKAVASATDEAIKKIVVDGKYLEHLTQLNDEITKLDTDQAAAGEKIAFESAQRKLAIYKAQIQQELAIQQSQNTVSANDKLIALDEKYRSGQLTSIAKYESEKAKIQRDSEIQSYNDSVTLFEKERNKLEADGKLDVATRADLDKKISDAKRASIDASVNYELNKQKQLRDALINLESGFIDAIATISQNQSDARIADLQAQLDAYGKTKDQELALAGDNKVAQDQINRKYAAEESEINKKIAKEKHDAAVFEKALSAEKVIVNTAVQVSQVLSNVPLAIAVAALGAVELATVLSAKVPAYKKGTKSSGEGLAIINEEGPEIVIDGRTKQAKLFDIPGAMLTHLSAGSEVITAERTRKIMMGHAMQQIGNIMIVDRKESAHASVESTELIKEMREIQYILKTKKEPNQGLSSRALRAIIRSEKSWSKVKNKFYP